MLGTRLCAKGAYGLSFVHDAPLAHTRTKFIVIFIVHFGLYFNDDIVVSNVNDDIVMIIVNESIIHPAIYGERECP